MEIVLTGTPGTGKSSVAEELKERGYRVIDLAEFARRRELGEERKEFEVDVPAMVEELEKELDEDEDTVIEGHLAHYYPADLCVVLRCRPDRLRERLEKRDYSDEKVNENVESEALDIILQQAIERQESIIELDTTERDPEDVAVEVEERVEKGDTGYGDVD
ncbi:MAG: adenylate kinase family protein, partial [Candidatus Nanohaloarchaea archaeon]